MIVSRAYNSKGDVTKFSSEENFSIGIYANHNDFVRLVIAEGVTIVCCSGNMIESLELPNSVNRLYCDKTVKGLENYIGKVKMLLY